MAIKYNFEPTPDMPTIRGYINNACRKFFDEKFCKLCWQIYYANKDEYSVFKRTPRPTAYYIVSEVMDFVYKKRKRKPVTKGALKYFFRVSSTRSLQPTERKKLLELIQTGYERVQKL